MSACFTPDEFVDLADGLLPAARRAHLHECASCRATADDVCAALALAAEADVPEPPALFWPGINARVRAAIAGSEGRRAWFGWLPWRVWLPIAGLAAVIVVVAATVDGLAPREPAAPPMASMAVLDDDLPRDDDDALALMVDLAASLPGDSWDALGVTRIPDLREAVSALSDDEQDALAELLHEAVERPKS